MNFARHHLKLLFVWLVLGIIGLVGSVFAINWNNQQFIDSAFWAQNPTSGDIVAALFGSNSLSPTTTAYSQNWDTNGCLGGTNISVQYVGTNSLPSQLNPNTIYVLTGNQAITGTVTFVGPCIGLVSSGGQYGLTNAAPSTGLGLTTSNAMLYATTANSIIIDGVSLNGYNASLNANFGLYINGANANHFAINNVSGTRSNSADIYVDGNASYIDVYNSVLGSNSTRGFDASQANNIFMDNVEIYRSTTNAMRLYATSGAVIANSRFHDSSAGNIYLDDAHNILFNNIQAFNNFGGSSLAVFNGSTNISVDNSMIYNSFSDGMYVQSSSNFALHNTMSVANGNYGFYAVDTTGITISKASIFGNQNFGLKFRINSAGSYYNANNIYNNMGNVDIEVGSTFATGLTSDTLVAGLGWTNGSIDQTNLNVSCYRRSYPQSLITTFNYACLDAGYQSWTPVVARTTTLFAEYVPLQVQAVSYTSPTSLGLYAGLYNTNLHISDSHRFGGRLTATGGANYQDQNGIFTTGTQLTLYSSESANYVITGDLMQTYTGVVNGTTTLSVQWSTGNGVKVITGYYYTGTKLSPLYRVIRFYDTIGPSQPINTIPVNSGTFVGTSVQLSRTNGVDTGVGTSGFYYQLSTNSGFTALAQAGWTTGATANLSGLAQTIYYRRVQAVDLLGNTSIRSTGTMFQYAFSGFVISIPNNTGLSANVANTISLSLYDTGNNVLTGYNGTIAWSITGINTPPNPPYNTFTIPTTGNLVASTSGVYTFANGLNITYPGQYQLTVYDINNPSVSGSIVVTVYGVAPSALSGSISVTPTYTSGAFTVNLATNVGSAFTLSGPFATISGTINTTTGIATAFNTVTQGSYPVTVVYATGFYVYTASTTVILDTTAPTVQVVSPSSGSTVSGSIVTITWTGSEFGTPSFSGYNVTVSDGVNPPTIQTGYGAQSMTLTLFDGVHTITITAIDQAGNLTTTTSSFTVDTTPPTITNPYPSQNTIGATPFNFGWTNVDSGGFNHATITLYDNDGNIIAGPAISYGTSVNLSTNLGLSTLPNGIYQWTLTTYDNAGNSTNGGPYIFTVLQPVSLGQIAGVLDFASLFGNVVQSGNTYYTNTTQLQAILASNMSTTVSINGNLSPTIIGFNLFSPFPYGVQAIQLTVGDGLKNLTALFTTGVLTPFSTVKAVILDTMAPTNLTLLSPANGGTVTGTFTLDWSDAIDSGAGLSGYVYQIDNNSGFTSVDLSGTTVNSTISLTTGGLTVGATYYWRVKAFDIVSNTITSDTGSFIIGTISSSSTDVTPNNFSFNDEDNADLDTSYISDQITVAGLGSGVQVLASVNHGVLYINNAVVGTTGMVDNGDKLKIELISSQNEGDDVSATLTVGNVSDTWTVTTDNNGNSNADLSRGERLQLSLIFDLLVETYQDNPSRALAFFQTLENAIQDMLDGNDLSHSEEQSLQYFLDLIQNYIDDEFHGQSTTLIYTAPNAKRYRVAFDEARNAFYSPDFVKPAYFDSKDSFASYIDRQNPGSSAGKWSDGSLLDGTNGTPNLGNNVIVAPNGKVYRITHTGNLRTSPDFTYSKTFASEALLRDYIITHNY